MKYIIDIFSGASIYVHRINLPSEDKFKTIFRKCSVESKGIFRATCKNKLFKYTLD